ncbi:MAG: hypothetical protein QM640_00260 [Niabella sp.]
MKLENLDDFEPLNEQETNVIKGGLDEGSTVESKKHDDDHATTDEE